MVHWAWTLVTFLAGGICVFVPTVIFLSRMLDAHMSRAIEKAFGLKDGEPDTKEGE